MDIDEIRKEQVRNECQGYRLGAFITKYDAVSEATKEIKKLPQCGRMEFTGWTGRIGENEPIVKISINAISGCVAVPQLLRELVEMIRGELDTDMSKL